MNTTKKDQIDVPRVVPRTGAAGISIHRFGLSPLTRRVVPPCQRMSLRCPPLSPKSGWTPRKPRGFTSPCPSAMQMLRTSRGREKLPFTIGDNGLQPRGLHRSSIGHPDIAAGNVPGVPFHHTAAAPALRDLRHGRHNTVRVRARIVVDHVVGDRRPPSRLFYRGCPSPTSAAPAGEAPNRGR